MFNDEGRLRNDEDGTRNDINDAMDDKGENKKSFKNTP
jgi:hypothetical protein